MPVVIIVVVIRFASVVFFKLLLALLLFFYFIIFFVILICVALFYVIFVILTSNVIVPLCVVFAILPCSFCFNFTSLSFFNKLLNDTKELTPTLKYHVSHIHKLN